MSWQYTISSFTKFSTLNGLNLVPFITSFNMIIYSSAARTQMQFSASVINSTDFVIKIEVQNFVNLKFLLGFVLFYQPGVIKANGGSYKQDGFTISTIGSNFDFSSQYPGWGARFNTKCFFGYW
jgi:hypothetical protein